MDRCFKCNTSNVLEIKNYYLTTAIILSFDYICFDMNVTPKWYAITDDRSIIDVETLTDTNISSPKTLFFDKAEVTAKMKELNKVENAKKKAFLAENSQIESKEGETGCYILSTQKITTKF
jgi:hypothetical protein